MPRSPRRARPRPRTRAPRAPLRPAPPSDPRRAFRRLRSLRRLHLAAFVASPLALAAAVATVRLTSSPLHLVLLLPVATLGAFALSAALLRRFTCPWCGARWFSRVGPLPPATNFPLARRCAGCGRRMTR